MSRPEAVPPAAAAADGGPGRVVALDGCVNFRDLGGYLTGDGRRVRWRRLFRADGLNRLSEADGEVLVGLGVATVIDLRTVDEAAARGRFPVDLVPVRYLDLPLTDVLPSTEELPSWREASYVASRYLDMVSAGGPALARAIEALAAEGSLPAVFHCSAGKDRTGVLAALVLAFLGVPDQTIVEDYVLSAAAMEHLLERLTAEYPDSVEEVLRYAPSILHVMPETMEEFLATVRSEHGGLTGLERALGVGASMDRLRRSMLEEV
ncbi:MAG TPA: tyrosine-protein phosphatase [Acidimicrobiales bacterium]|jgi:protein-tyrosine phosphatase|nr:tyrosine-protein phosphatase [Acidimicrobiales bacterium]